MTDNNIDLLAISKGTITAPAGCGKTHLIADTLKRHCGSKPILVLTHTNAGVAALRHRLDRAGVPSKAYRLCTIDGWAIRLISTFPSRSAHDPDILQLDRPGTDYPNIRTAAISLINSGHIGDVLAASYAQLVVDEYQDCSERQHALVTEASGILPTCVLGDPMQAIFGFGNDILAHWENDVCTQFPVVAVLDKPWRWINAGSREFGDWLLELRSTLLEGNRIDLSGAPTSVNWIELDGSDDYSRQLKAARTPAPEPDGRVLIMADSKKPSAQRQIASQTPGAITVEAVDLKDFIAFARTFSPTAPDALQKLVDFAETVMTNVGGANLIGRVASLARGTNRKSASEVEQAALKFNTSRTFSAAADLLAAIGRDAGVRQHRPAVVRACMRSLQHCESTEGISLHEAAVLVREQNRLRGRSLPKRAVGSTLLLKGLEAEVAVILNGDDLNAQHLYVAATRGSKKLVICSKNSVLP